MSTSAARREELTSVFKQARGCTRCPQLASTRTQVVFGSGNADADLMFVGEAPGAKEDDSGVPFVGAAGKLLDELLAGVGLARADVFIANVLMCRPPGNRDPQPGEIDNCQGYLMRKVELIQPSVICTLGNFSTKLLRGDPTGISRLHGQAEIIAVGNRAVRLYPLYHPAAALYTRSLLDTLRADIARLPALLALGPPAQPELVEVEVEPEAAAVPDPRIGVEPAAAPAAAPAPEPAPAPASDPERPDWATQADEPADRQLGLF
ncbi:MAG TPA: uracil-DNA glycosylase [Solirubrobacteraceae bacterium]|nr:uracil-DNA glycosylase [Solirubrobacteraceae bacterium]